MLTEPVVASSPDPVGGTIGLPLDYEGRVSALLQKALNDSWRIDNDLPWDLSVDLEALDLPERESLVSRLPAWQSLSEGQRRQAKLHELGWNLSNLLEGEWRGGVLASQIVVDCAEESREIAAFVTVVAHDEVKHHHVLDRYLRQHTELVMPAHRGLNRLFTDLRRHDVWELKVLVGQVLFEATATSTLHSLFMRSREPLLTAILRRIMKDEARHLAFSHAVTGSIARRYPAATVRATEDIMFEAIVACVATFAAEPVWDALGLPLAACRRASVEALGERGILDLYLRVLPLQLARRGFPPERLSRLLEAGLVPALLASGVAH